MAERSHSKGMLPDEYMKTGLVKVWPKTIFEDERKRDQGGGRWMSSLWSRTGMGSWPMGRSPPQTAPWTRGQIQPRRSLCEPGRTRRPAKRAPRSCPAGNLPKPEAGPPSRKVFWSLDCASPITSARPKTCLLQGAWPRHCFSTPSSSWRSLAAVCPTSQSPRLPQITY